MKLKEELVSLVLFKESKKNSIIILSKQNIIKNKILGGAELGDYLIF